MTLPLPTAPVRPLATHVLRRGLPAALLCALSLSLAACASDSNLQVKRADELVREAERSARQETAAPDREPGAESRDPGVSLSDLPHARLAAQTSQSCLAAIETAAERFSGRRVMLGDAAFVDRSEVVLDQVFARGPDGQILDGRRTQPNPFVMQLRFGPNGCMLVIPAQSSAVRPVPAATLLRECRCFEPKQD